VTSSVMSRTERPPAVRSRRSCWKTFTGADVSEGRTGLHYFPVPIETCPVPGTRHVRGSHFRLLGRVQERLANDHD
jgi:hypothetical protein